MTQDQQPAIGAAPTVGDTVWAVRTVAVPAGRTLRPATWDLAGPVELLGPPRVTQLGDSATVAYPLVVWTPGAHVVEVPGPVLVRDDGGLDSLPPLPMTVTAASVLPEKRDTALRPQPAAGYIPRSETSPVPLLVLLGIAVLLLLPLQWWWRRRGRAPAAGERPVSVPPPLARWVDMGEFRAALADAAERLVVVPMDGEREVARRRLLEEIDVARFEAVDRTDRETATALLARADTLLGRE